MVSAHGRWAGESGSGWSGPCFASRTAGSRHDDRKRAAVFNVQPVPCCRHQICYFIYSTSFNFHDPFPNSLLKENL